MSIIRLSAGELDEPISVKSALTDANRLERIYDSVLQNMDAPAEWLYLDSLESLAVKAGNPTYQGLVYRNRVRYYYNKTNFDSAVYYAGQAIPFFRKNNQRESLTDVESMIVNLHTWRNEHEFALRKGNEMYDESERIGDKKGMIAACENIGFALVNSYREKDALGWYRKSLGLLRGMKGAELDLVRIEMLVADCFLTLNEVDSMKAHLDVMRHLLVDFEADGDRRQKGRVRMGEYWVWLYAHQAEASVREKDFEKAKSCLEEAGRYVSAGVESMSMEVYYWARSNFYQAQGDYDRALEEEVNSFKYSFTYADDSPQQLYRFAAIYAGKGEAAHAVSLYKRGLAQSDSINNALLVSQISQFYSIYEVNELTEEVEHQRLEVGRLRLILVSLFAFALLLCLFVFIINRYKKRLSGATLKAKEADLKTTIFLDNVSREIRLALDVIAGLSRELIQERDGMEKKRYSALVRGKNETLQRVIFNILDVSKIESDRMVFDYMNIHLPDMMSEVKGWADNFLASGRSFRLESAPGLYVKSDISRLRQIMENLLFFFVTHSQQGDILMEYHLEGEFVEFNMSCAGLHLGDKERDLLFDRQVQVGKRLEDMGLELVICRDLAIRMGGVLSISDKVEVGAGFTFALPIGTT